MTNTITKVCTQCHEVKPLSGFGKRKSRKSGLTSECKSCACNRAREHNHTKTGLLTKIYSRQRLSSKQRNHELPDYNLDEFRAWAYSKPEFHRLYDDWVESNYEKMLAPSADRFDDYETYTLDNLQWVTWAENTAKGHSNRVNGINNKVNKAVIQMSLDCEFISEYHSICHAARVVGGYYQNIIKCCKGNLKSTGGYKWRYAE